MRTYRPWAAFLGRDAMPAGVRCRATGALPHDFKRAEAALKALY
ncbi:hypothetical protein [Azospirillum largimobile]